MSSVKINLIKNILKKRTLLFIDHTRVAYNIFIGIMHDVIYVLIDFRVVQF